MEVLAPAVAEREASVGDMLVLAQTDPAPPTGWMLVAVERAPANPIDAATPTPVLESVYRLG
jgi:predicted secreted protein